MNLKFYLEKLHISEEYKKFIQENPGAYLCSGFFVIDKEGSDSKQHLDYYVPYSSSQKLPAHSHSQIDNKQLNEKTPNEKSVNNLKIPSTESASNSRGKIFSFQLEDGIKIIPIETIDNKILEGILGDCDFDLTKIEKMIVSEMIYKGIQKKLQKILLSLQNKEGRDFLIGTIFISGLGMLKVQINLPEMKIIEFEKKSFFDILRKK